MKGKTGKITKFNAQGSAGEKEADETKAEFKKGGGVKKHKKHAHGGHVKGEKPKHRLDRKPRAAGGRTPYSGAKGGSGGASEDEGTGKGEVKGKGAMTEIPVND